MENDGTTTLPTFTLMLLSFCLFSKKVETFLTPHLSHFYSHKFIDQNKQKNRMHRSDKLFEHFEQLSKTKKNVLVF